ncbi:MAG: CheR family methyltransferase [Hyphomonadaceae bacterium]
MAQLVLRHTKGQSIRSANVGGQYYRSPIEYIFMLIVEQYGTDFRNYKTSTVERRIRRRYEMRGLNSFQTYADYLATDESEMEALYNDLLIDVTTFFRDGDAFDKLAEKVIAPIASKMTETHQIRIWVPACSSGEEPYSIAMLVADYARQNNLPLNVKILATDIHHGSLEVASAGIYSEENVRPISPERISRFFQKHGDNYHVKPELRKLVVFTPHSLFVDPPFTRLDLISCRNMLIYLKGLAQDKAMALFHFALNKNGFLFLGPSETVAKLDAEFSTVDQRWRIYRKKRDIRLIESTTVLRNEAGQASGQSPFTTAMPRTSMRNLPTHNSGNRRAVTAALYSLLSKYGPAGFLVDLNGELVQTFGEAGKFISVREGEFSNRLVDLLHSDLTLAVTAGLERIRVHLLNPFQRRIKTTDEHGDLVGALLKIESLPDTTGSPSYLLVTIAPDASADANEGVEFIEDAEATGLLQMRVKELERDLASTEESLQSTIEELETSNEELQATNEELMASNEELQSTNEELHSVNEELYTVSAEHQRKIEELLDLTNDMDQLLKSTDIGTVFLDPDLKVRRFTPAATKTFNLLQQDISRPFDHITHKFDGGMISKMVEDARKSNKTVEAEFDLEELHYLVRVLPYQSMPDAVPEIVITVLDITEVRDANQRTTKIYEFSRSVLEDIGEYIVRWRKSDGVFTYANEPFAKLIGYPVDQIIGRSVDELILATGPESEFRSDWSTLKPGDSRKIHFKNLLANGPPMHREGSVRAVGNSQGNVVEFQSSSRNSTQDVNYLEALEALIDDQHQFSNNSDEDTIQGFLKTASSFFGLENGILSQYTQDGLVTVSSVGPHPDKVLTGRKSMDSKNPSYIPLKMAQNAKQDAGAIAIGDTLHSKLKSRQSIKQNNIRSYIGAPVFNDGKLYGSVCFYADTQRDGYEFSRTEVGFIMLLARWIGYKIERREQIALLIRNEMELKFIFDNIPDRIWYKDDKGNVLRLNQTAADFMGVDAQTPSNVRGYNLDPQLAQEHHADDLAVIRSGKSQLGAVRKTVAANGAEGWGSFDKVPFENFDTGDRNLLVVSRDVTAIKQREMDIETLNLELKQANDGLRQFAYVASHDLQEPLRKIRQFSEILVDTYSTQFDAEGVYFLSVVSESAARLSTLIKDLLDYSKTSYMNFAREDVDMAQVASDILVSFEDLAQAANCQIKMGKLPVASGDVTMIEQLFSNLVGNAIKYRHPDRPSEISLSSRRLKQQTIVTIADNGIGMDKKHIDRIFEPFARLKNSSAASGSGIGLAICKSVCERHGWEIYATSVLDEGTKFKIKIPHDQSPSMDGIGTR